MTGDKVCIPNLSGGVEELTWEEFLGLASKGYMVRNPSGVCEVFDGDGNKVTTLTAEEALAYMTAKPQ